MAPSSIPESAAVFPLPNAVLFPRASLSLHVFETRYREMTRYAVRSGGLLCSALLRPGWEEEYEGSPAVYDVGCVGRIGDLHETEDGRFYYTLYALGRVRFRDFLQTEPFRIARLEPAPEPEVPRDESARRDTLELLASYAAVLQLLNPNVSDSLALPTGVPLPDAVDQVLMRLDFDVHTKQRLLSEVDPRGRCRWVTKLLSTLLHGLHEQGQGQGQSVLS
jgi:Lon protease-like protein